MFIVCVGNEVVVLVFPLSILAKPRASSVCACVCVWKHRTAFDQPLFLAAVNCAPHQLEEEGEQFADQMRGRTASATVFLRLLACESVPSTLQARMNLNWREHKVAASCRK